MKKLILFILVLCTAFVASAQDNKVIETNIEHNIIQDGRVGLKISVNFEAVGQDHLFHPYVLVYDETNAASYHQDTNGDYRHENTGAVCAQGENIKGPFEINHIEASSMFLPLDEIHPYEGSRTYYIRVFIQDATINETIASGDYVAFEMNRK